MRVELSGRGLFLWVWSWAGTPPSPRREQLRGHPSFPHTACPYSLASSSLEAPGYSGFSCGRPGLSTGVPVEKERASLLHPASKIWLHLLPYSVEEDTHLSSFRGKDPDIEKTHLLKVRWVLNLHSLGPYSATRGSDIP